MLFEYRAIDTNGITREGTVEAANVDAAIATVQQRGYTVISMGEIKKGFDLMNIEVTWFQRISNKEVVILSRQIATLFQAQVSALRVFRLLSAEAENPQLKKILNGIAEDLQGGSSISRAMQRYPEVFSNFYISLVRAGEESGSLEKSFNYLADYLNRMYEVISKARNALIYPAFVIGTFVVVMVLMLTLVIPRISQILIESGQELPIYTKIVIALSSFFANYIGFILVLCAALGIAYWRFKQTDVGARTIDEFKLTIPALGNLYNKLYLTRICDNLSTMLASGISMVQALEVTAEVVDNLVYKDILEQTLSEVKGGRSFADAISEFPEIPGVLAQMAKVGEETGNLSSILQTLSEFYRREVNNAVDTLIGLIEPAMIVLLGLGVGTLLASVLMPIYNISDAL